MKKLLIVDDEAEMRDSIREIFEPRGFYCLDAKNGLEAVKLARKERPCVIILDLIMPEMDGIKTRDLLKADKSTRDIPIIAYTAQDPEVVAKKGERAFDVIDFVLKPFDAKALMVAVEKAISNNKST